MNKGRSRLVPVMSLAGLLSATAAIMGCIGPPDLGGSADPLVVAETDRTDLSGDPGSGRAAAIAEMRTKAEAGEAMPFPDAFQAGRTSRLAERPEPKPLNEVAVLQTELASVAERQRTANADEIAGLKTREAELRRLLAAAQAGNVRP